ncbi:MAG: hypothetical protein LBR46_05250 [Prevotella sp.]|jgi:hypothetical protein|nr:hypothetical protein [Prevotella sp.]
MKKIMLFILSVFTMISCDPLVDNKDMGGILSEDQIDISVKSTTEGSNEIVMENYTPGIVPYWDFIINTSTNQKETAVMPFIGELTISCTAICNGGTVTTTRKVNVTKLDKPIPEQWNMLASEELSGKVWVWDTDQPFVYGTAGYGNNYAPAWSAFNPGGQVMAGKIVSTDEEMVFDRNGGPNFTRRKTSGTVVEKGLFKFDMTKQKIRDDGAVWSIGQMQFTNATVITGSSCWSNDPVYTFDIISLSADKMVLAYAAPGTEFQVWNEATFWCFKAK